MDGSRNDLRRLDIDAKEVEAQEGGGGWMGGRKQLATGIESEVSVASSSPLESRIARKLGETVWFGWDGL